MSGYLYNGTRREGLPDLETANAAIMAARTRQPAELGGFEWPAARQRGMPRCGTERGYRAHLRAHQKPCEGCAAAHRGTRERERAA